jgi:hypothetical protein
MGQTAHLLLELEPAMAKLREMSWALKRNREARTEMGGAPQNHPRRSSSKWLWCRPMRKR